MARISNLLFSILKHSNPNPNPNPLRFLSSIPRNPNPNPIPPRPKTPIELEFQSITSSLPPNFTPSDVNSALLSIPDNDPDLALDLFRWSALRPGFRHDPTTYHTILSIQSSARRFSAAETLIQEIHSGASGTPNLRLYNTAIRFCCSRPKLFSTAFDLFKKMQKHGTGFATVETYTMLLASILRRIGKPPVSYVYLGSVRALIRQMKQAGVVPEMLTLNLIIQAFSRCLEMDEAVRVFKEMVIYGCEPDEYSYGYIARGMCEKGMIDEGFGYFKKMRGKGLVPTRSVYSGVVCCLALEGRFEEAVKVVYDMLEERQVPDMLMYRTLLEGLCRAGKVDDAFQLLEEFGAWPKAMRREVYDELLEGLHWICQPLD